MQLLHYWAISSVGRTVIGANGILVGTEGRKKYEWVDMVCMLPLVEEATSKCGTIIVKTALYTSAVTLTSLTVELVN